MWVADHYDENLKRYSFMNDSFRDIVKVFKPKHICDLKTMLKDENLILIWDRDAKYDMTIEEIEKQLGYKINLIPSKKEKENE